MTDPDLLASATLARLYMEQDHLSRAREVLDAALARAPLDGPALALRARLSARSPAHVQIEVTDDALLVTWRRVPHPRRCRVSLWLYVPGEDPTHHEIPTERSNGRHRWLCPPGPGAAVACVRGPAPGEDPGAASPDEVLAVAHAATWGAPL